MQMVESDEMEIHRKAERKANDLIANEEKGGPLEAADDEKKDGATGPGDGEENE